jgi:L-amino acid N-acyltransferase YncA
MMRPPNAYLQVARDVYRYQGLPSLLWRATVKAVSPIARLELAFLYRIELSRDIPQFRARAPVVLRQAGTDDIAQVARLMAKSGDAAGRSEAEVVRVIAQRRARGSICFLAMAGDAIAHYNWLSFGWKESLAGRFIVLESHSAYCGGGYTPERWRGLGIHTEVNAAMLHYLQGRGFRRAYTFVHAENRASRKTIERVGWHRSGVALAFTMRGERHARILRLQGRLEPFMAPNPPQPLSGLT